MGKKISMVQPRPANPDMLKLLKLLKLMGNNRAYTVISRGGSMTRPTWVIHFEGDKGPTKISLQGDKTKSV